jgi:hypothetical protein
MIKNYSQLEKTVYRVPEDLDKRVARLKLESMGIKIDRLTPEQEEYLAELGYRERRGVLRLPTYPYPFLFKIPDYQPPPAPAQEETDRRLREMLGEWTWTPDTEAAAIPKPPPAAGATVFAMESPSADAYNYLCAVVTDYFVPATVRDRRMHLGGERGNRIREELKERGLAEEREIETGKPGGKVKLVMPTQAGYELLDTRKLKYKKPSGIGSVEHEFWQRTIAGHLKRRGWKANASMWERTRAGGTLPTRYTGRISARRCPTIARTLTMVGTWWSSAASRSRTC